MTSAPITAHESHRMGERACRDCGAFRGSELAARPCPSSALREARVESAAPAGDAPMITAPVLTELLDGLCTEATAAGHHHAAEAVVGYPPELLDARATELEKSAARLRLAAVLKRLQTLASTSVEVDAREASVPPNSDPHVVAVCFLDLLRRRRGPDGQPQPWSVPELIAGVRDVVSDVAPTVAMEAVAEIVVAQHATFTDGVVELTARAKAALPAPGPERRNARGGAAG